MKYFLFIYSKGELIISMESYNLEFMKNALHQYLQSEKDLKDTIYTYVLNFKY